MMNPSFITVKYMKYLLCRPRGGLNDSLNQIELCWRYAEKHSRVLIIDTEYLVSTGISVQFSKLFVAGERNENVLFNLSPALLENLNELNTFPNSCQGRLSSYKSKWVAEFSNLVDSDTGVQLSFDFDKSYEEDLLVHDQLGGGLIGIHCLARLKLNDQFRMDVINLLAPLVEKKYLAINVRHTDYQTDYKRCFNEVYEKSINQSLLICSDSCEVINFAVIFFNRSEVIYTSLPPDTGGIGLATYAAFHCNDDQRYHLMVKALADLIGMASASEAFYCKLLPGMLNSASNKYSDFSGFFELLQHNPTMNVGLNGLSGFAFLIDSLRNNPTIINRLLCR